MNIDDMTQDEQDEAAFNWIVDNAPDYVLEALDIEREEYIEYIQSLEQSLSDLEYEYKEQYRALKELVEVVTRMISTGYFVDDPVLSSRVSFANKFIEKRGLFYYK